MNEEYYVNPSTWDVRKASQEKQADSLTQEWVARCQRLEAEMKRMKEEVKRLQIERDLLLSIVKDK